jgi:hypothetical protein
MWLVYSHREQSWGHAVLQCSNEIRKAECALLQNAFGSTEYCGYMNTYSQLTKQRTGNKSITPMSPEQTSKAAQDCPAHCLIICYKLEKLCIDNQYEEEQRLGEETVMTNLNGDVK